MKFTTHNNTKKLYSRNKNLKYIGLIILFPFGLFICLTVCYLNSWNNEHLATPTMEIPERFTVKINNADAVVSEYSDFYSARLQLINGNHQRIINVKWDK